MKTLKTAMMAAVVGLVVAQMAAPVGAEPVSYTHLDVYKRQALAQRWRSGGPEFRHSDNALRPCLLYTSRCV